MNKNQAKEKIKKLVSEYESLKSNNDLRDKNEAFTKQRFIQPFFEALGWDFRTDVWPEENVSKDRVDYAFKIGDFIKFFVEAKKFSVDLDEEKWAEQAIEYAWNKSVTWAVLTDFEGLKIFNSEWNKKPYRAVKEFTYKDYLERFDEIWFLAKESIEKGELDRSAEDWGVKEKKAPVTEQLAQDLTKWRDGLKKEIEVWNQGKYPEEQIDEAVQRFLDRLIFIRYAEDKELEPPTLEPILRDYKKSGGDLIKKLNRLFRQFDGWYDSRLFEEHFSERMEAYSGNLEEIIEGLYRSKKTGHPYDFSAISADVLGAVYEQYLGYLQKKESKNEQKSSKRKEQGIYYTPSFVVDYIVQNTLGTLLKEKSKDEVRNIKILDPACGSGSFLIKACQALIDYHQQLGHKEIDTKTKIGEFEKIMLEKKGLQALSVPQKLSILRENIYGVDLDSKAVEIAQLNLLLKAIAKRTRLPNLSHKIVCGNSLISGQPPELEKYFGKKWREQKPFIFEEEFGEVFEKKLSKFHLLTFETKYSRQKSRDKNVEGVVLSSEEMILVAECIVKSVEELGIKLLEASISPDHVHLVIADMGREIADIVKQIKGFSAHRVNRRFKSSVQGEGYQQSLWSKSYNDSFLDDEKHLFSAIEYVKNNHLKHEEKWGKVDNAKIQKILTPALYDVSKFQWSDFEYSEGGFDMIIGNPPYVQLSMEEKLPAGLKEFLLDTYQSSMGRLNTFGFFIRRGIELLKDGGYLGFIIPNTILTQDYYEELRKYILDNCAIESIVSFDNLPFKDAVVENVVLILKRITSERVRNNNKVSVYKVNEGLSASCDKSIIQKLFVQSYKHSFNISLNEQQITLREKIEKDTSSLSSFLNVNQAIALRYERNKWISDKKLDDDYKPLLVGGKNINRYSITWDGTFLKYDPTGIHSGGDKEKFVAKEKIFFRRVSDHLIGALDTNQFYGLHTLVVMTKKKATSLDIRFFLALFNSKLLNFYYRTVFASTKKIFSEIGARQIAQLPIKNIDLNSEGERKKHDKIIFLVNEIIILSAELKKLSSNTDKHNSLKREIEKLDHQIDEEVYKIYGLTAEEIRIVEA